ncbi:MAG TPA: translocation/assembly module TamB domain-containing protein [Holophagaceae bacterium]|nr:translocation/assembly module TamB domain-containing protein [Holophagaceae bacterium]
MIHPTREGCRRLWARPWVRRITYALVGGATVLQVGGWILERPGTTRWVVSKIDAKVREETGLSFQLERVEARPFSGLLILHHVALGGDLLTIKRLEARFDPRSLASNTPRIHLIRIEEPVARISEARLQALKLKPHPKDPKPNPQVRLDLLQVVGGRVLVDGPAWGVPILDLPFQITGQGLGANRLRLGIQAPGIKVEGPSGPERGALELDADLSEEVLSLIRASISLGRSQVKAQGRYEVLSQRSELHLKALADLAQASAWGKLDTRASGEIRLATRLSGSLLKPRWSVDADGANLDTGIKGIQPGRLVLQAKGSDRGFTLEDLAWSSPQGTLAASGAWAKGGIPTLKFSVKELQGELPARFLRVQDLAQTRFSLQGQAQGPRDSAALARPDRWSVQVAAEASDAQGPAGTLDARLDAGQARFKAEDLRLGSLRLNAEGTAGVGAKGLTGLQGEGRLEVRAESVAKALQAWKITDLPMGGAVNAQAKVAFSPQEGLSLEGKVAVARPRWELEEADDVAALVRIRKDQLWVDQLTAHAGGGEVTGNLWLTWSKAVKGDQLDMCFAASRVAASHGLRAAGLTDEDIGVKLEGTGHGWARLHGPFNNLQMEGQATAEAASLEVLGDPPPASTPSPFRMKVPAASARFEMDIETLRMRLRDIRVASDLGSLEPGAAQPSGPLALKGELEMDIVRRTWWGRLTGLLDTGPFETDLPLPRITGQADLLFEGPYVQDFGPWPLPRGHFKLTGARVLLGDRSLEGLNLNADLTGNHLRASLSKGTHGAPMLSVDATKSGTAVEGRLALKITPETCETEDLASRLTQDFMEDLRAEFQAQGRWSPEADLTWKGQLDRLEGTFPAFSLRQSKPSLLQGTGAGANLDLFIEGLQRKGLSPEGQLRPSASVRLKGSLPFSAAVPMGVRAEGSMELGDLKTIADVLLDIDEGSLLHSLRPEGQGTFNLLARGTYADPKLEGTLDVENANLRLAEYENIRELGLHVKFQERTISILPERPLTGTLNQGHLRAHGEVKWRPGGLDGYEFNAQLKSFQIQDPPDLQGLIMQGDLEATLRGDDSGGVLKGAITTSRLSYQTDIKLYDWLVNSALAESSVLSTLDPNDPLDKIRLDLDVKMDRPWELDTNLAKLEGRPEGAFRIQGTLARPGLKGRMVLEPGGRITNLLPAGDVVLSRGTFDFTDPDLPINPHLDLSGDVQVPGYTVTVGITGTMANLNWQLSSIPRLSQSDMVAVLINPEYAQSAGTTPGGSQGAVNSGLASASTGLLTTLALAAFQEQVRKTFRLDRVSVSVRTGTTGTTETDVILGKRVNLFGWKVPLIVSQRRSRDLTTTSGQVEWHFGGFTLQLGATQSQNSGVNPSGEIRHTWSPKN